MVADIATGHTAAADVLLLIAAVVFVAVAAAGRRDGAGQGVALTPAGLALVALALLLW